MARGGGGGVGISIDKCINSISSGRGKESAATQAINILTNNALQRAENLADCNQRAMSAIEKNWQTTKPTIRERSKHMFNNDLFSDVKFVVRGESESKQVIPAHKYDSLLELFRYMYSDELILSGSNVMGVLYLAKKYMVPSLADKCAEYLRDNLDTSNAFSILPQVQKYEEKTLLEQCWEVIDEQTQGAVKTDGFLTLERSLLEALVERDTLRIQEVELFKAVNLWATKRCEEQGLSTDGIEKRRILGERIVKGIRFPVMTQHEFADVVLDCKILTPEESFTMVKYLNSIRNTPVGFPETERTGLKELFERCCRFGAVVHTGSGYPYSPGKKDCLRFVVDKDISLLGLTLCGSRNSEYYVCIQIKRFSDSDYRHRLCLKAGTFSSVCIKSDQVSYYGFNVFFDSPVEIKKGVKHRLKASISGSTNSWSGRNGQHSVLCSGVRFDFMDSSESTNGTRVELGQFPEFLFTVKIDR